MMSAWLAFRASYSPLLTSSWQVFPTALEALLQDEDDARLQWVMEAMLAKTKIDMAELERGYADE